MDEAAVAMEAILDNWKFSKPIYEAAARRMVETGGGVFSHPVGLAVHDVDRYKGKPLVPDSSSLSTQPCECRKSSCITDTRIRS